MTGFTPGGQFPVNASVDLLSVLEARVQTGLLAQIANTADNNVNTLRNDEATVLGLTVPVASA